MLDLLVTRYCCQVDFCACLRAKRQELSRNLVQKQGSCCLCWQQNTVYV